MPSDLWWAQVIVPGFQNKAVGPVDPSFLAVKKSHINKASHLTARL